MSAFISFVQNNFIHAGPILGLGIIAVVIMLERINALYVTYAMPGTSAFFEKIRELILNDKVSEAILLCDRYEKKPVSRIMKEALLRAHQPDELVEQGIQIAVSQATEKIQKRTSFLATIANVATLVGLFGTILGLIHAFEALGGASAQQKSALLSAGISTAMNATLMGLGVAIPCMLVFSFLASKSNSLISEIERSAMRALDLIKQRCYTIESQSGKGSSHSDSVAKGA